MDLHISITAEEWALLSNGAKRALLTLQARYPVVKQEVARRVAHRKKGEALAEAYGDPRLPRADSPNRTMSEEEFLQRAREHLSQEKNESASPGFFRRVAQDEVKDALQQAHREGRYKRTRDEECEAAFEAKREEERRQTKRQRPLDTKFAVGDLVMCKRGGNAVLGTRDIVRITAVEGTKRMKGEVLECEEVAQYQEPFYFITVYKLKQPLTPVYQVQINRDWGWGFFRPNDPHKGNPGGQYSLEYKVNSEVEWRETEYVTSDSEASSSSSSPSSSPQLSLCL